MRRTKTTIKKRDGGATAISGFLYQVVCAYGLVAKSLKTDQRGTELESLFTLVREHGLEFELDDQERRTPICSCRALPDQSCPALRAIEERSRLFDFRPGRFVDSHLDERAVIGFRFFRAAG